MSRWLVEVVNWLTELSHNWVEWLDETWNELSIALLVERKSQEAFRWAWRVETSMRSEMNVDFRRKGEIGKWVKEWSQFMWFEIQLLGETDVKLGNRLWERILLQQKWLEFGESIKHFLIVDRDEDKRREGTFSVRDLASELKRWAFHLCLYKAGLLS